MGDNPESESDNQGNMDVPADLPEDCQSGPEPRPACDCVAATCLKASTMNRFRLRKKRRSVVLGMAAISKQFVGRPAYIDKGLKSRGEI
jgi:hypothetical protein